MLFNSLEGALSCVVSLQGAEGYNIEQCQVDKVNRGMVWIRDLEFDAFRGCVPEPRGSLPKVGVFWLRYSRQDHPFSLLTLVVGFRGYALPDRAEWVGGYKFS